MEPSLTHLGGIHRGRESDIRRLREYVLKRGGFIYMMTHGNTPVVMKDARRLIHEILPDYPLALIPNDHEIYSAYYNLDGPLRFPFRNPIAGIRIHSGRYRSLKGVFIDGRLAVLVDTEQTMHVIDGALENAFVDPYTNMNGALQQLTPHATRQMINFIVYAITHGGISDYTDYVPKSDQ